MIVGFGCGIGVQGVDLARTARLQGYLAHKKRQPPQEHQRALDIGLL